MRPAAAAALLATAVALAACGGGVVKTAPRAEATSRAVDDASTWLLGWERVLATTPRLAIMLHAEIGSPYDGRMDARILLDGERARVDATGSFGDEPFTLRWIFDGARISTGEEPPPDVRAKLATVGLGWSLSSLVGLLVVGTGPLADQPDLSIVRPRFVGGPPGAGAKTVVVEFDQRINDLAHGTTRVTFDASTRLPTRRDTEVALGDDVMEEVETYTIDLTPEIPADAFVMPALAP